MPDRAFLHPIDPELVPGARNAIEVCLRLKKQERITIITDEATREIAAALQQRGGANRFGAQRVCSGTSRATATEIHAETDSRGSRHLPGLVFAALTQPGELDSRREMTAVVDRHRIRHGHMVNINREIMREGMRADFLKVDELSQRLVERARTRRTDHLQNASRDRIRSQALAETEMAQDQRNHSGREMGQPALAAKFLLRR